MSVTIKNETDYSLSATVLNQIERDAIEYFGESVNLIRIQYGIARHAFNAKTGEVRYSFSPGDFGLVDAPTAFADGTSRDDVPSIDDDREELQDSAFDGEADGDDDDAPAFVSMEDDLDVTTDDDGPKFHSLDTDFETLEDAERSFLFNEDFDD